MIRNGVSLSLFLLALSFCPLWGQESRGSITGKVSDPQGAVIPGASVVVTNTETNTITRLTTNATGYFEANLLNPGKYSITVEAQGFRKTVRTGLELSVAGRLDIEFQLQVGTISETVEVTAEAPLLDTTTASGGRVIDNRQIMELPFNDLNPFVLAGLAAGMQWTGQPEYRKAFDNAGTSAFNTSGGLGQNEYTLDGAPVTGTGRRVGFTPPSDAVEEFKMETTTFDAAYGHTSGATVNVTTKSGTNTYHGSLYDQHWQQRWNATPHFTRLQWENQVAQGKRSADSQKQASGHSNQFGGTAGGPVRFPKLYNGTDKLFFFFSYNGIYQNKAETTSSVNRSVPKMAWRQGDFSDMLALDAVKYTVYDPRSARLEGSRVVRTPFPGNKGVPVLNPMYRYYEPMYPKPNDVPGLVSADGANNYYASAMPKNERFNSILNRIDYNLSERHRLNGRWFWNHRLADEYDWMYETKRGIEANGLTRINKGLGVDYIWAASGTTVLNLGVSWARFNEGSVNSVLTSYKPSDVGLPAYLDAKAGQYKVLPQIDFQALEDASASYPAITTRGTTGEAKIMLSHIRGNHSLKFGYMERRYWFTGAGPGYSGGRFQHDNRYTKAADNTTTAANNGLEWAAFMMGLPYSVSVDTNDSSLYTTRYRALYVQDDWRVSSKFRLNLGLRYEREGGTTERYNRGLATGFLWDYKPAFADAVVAAYAKSPLAELPASQFSVLGGTQYLGTNGVNTWTEGTHRFAPRAGLVYQFDNKTVVRGGYGWFYDTFNVNNDRPSQDGYSQATSTTMTNDNALSYCPLCGVGAASNLSASVTPMHNPFPVRADGTRFDTAYGNSLGPAIRWGRGYTGNSAYPRDYRPGAQQRWRIGVQREIGKNMVIEASYNGAYAYFYVEKQYSALPQQYWATGSVRNTAVDSNLQTNVPNPFNVSNFASLETSNAMLYNYLRTQSLFTASTIRKQALLRPYPLMGTDFRSQKSFEDSKGYGWYRDLQVQFERRFSKGFQSSVMYTWTKSTVADWYANEFDAKPTERPNNNSLPHRFVWSAIYQLPFGKGRQLVQSGPLQHIVGGWQLSWIYQIQSGPCTGNWGNRFFYGDMNNIAAVFNHDEVHSKDIHVWFDPNIVYKGSGSVPSGFVGFEGRSGSQPGSYHVRMFPIRLDSLRADGIRNWDVRILRRFNIYERLNTSFAVDLLNATNHTNFSGPNLDPTNANFGRVTSQRGLSRLIQFNLRIDF